MVDDLVKMFEMEIVEKKGTSCRRLLKTRSDQPSATSPPFLDNLHFEHFDKSVNLVSWLTLLSECSKWRLSKKGGLVADGWSDAVVRTSKSRFGYHTVVDVHTRGLAPHVGNNISEK